MHTPNSIKCLIVDDEPLAQQVLVAHISQISALQISGLCNNAMEAFEALHKDNIDLVFLDINMPVVNGLGFLKSLKDPPMVILTTAYTEYAMEGYELDVIDYLLKPISFERFQKAVGKALSQKAGTGKAGAQAYDRPAALSATSVASPSGSGKSYFFVKADGKLVKINYDDIRFIEGMKDYLKIHLRSQKVVTHSTMKAMEEQLPTDRFFRVHKSYIVALEAIKSIEGSILHLDTADKAEIPLGNSYRDALLSVVAAS